MIQTYATPAAFRDAVEQRIRKAKKPATSDLGRFRQALIFDRFLARIGDAFKDRAIAKGGAVLELRLQRARMTRDVDLRIIGSPDGLGSMLSKAGALDLGDFMRFEVRPDRKHPEIKGEGVVYGGKRFTAQAFIAGVRYGMQFGVDVGTATC
jgi:hypothetical protein